MDAFWLAEALEALAGRLGPEESSTAARLLFETMGEVNNPAAWQTLAETLSLLLGRLEPAEAADRALLVARAIGGGASPPTRLCGLAILLQALQPPPCRLDTQQLVDLLKMPTCVGSARDVVLQMLGQKCNRHFSDLWQFVEYAHDHRPDLDLTTPPKRP
jgi:hypothetical protein